MKIFSLEQFDPRVKIIMMLCFSTLALTTKNLFFLTLITCLAFLILCLGGTEFLLICRRIRGIAGIILSLFMIQCIFIRTGSPLLLIGGFSLVTVGGAKIAAMLGLRLFHLGFFPL